MRGAVGGASVTIRIAGGMERWPSLLYTCSGTTVLLKFRGRRVSWVGLLSIQMGRFGAIVGKQRLVDYCETGKRIVFGPML
ncbi:hypothetical protein LINPERHAP2_LOCUS15181 [Linum perenne]